MNECATRLDKGKRLVDSSRSHSPVIPGVQVSEIMVDKSVLRMTHHNGPICLSSCDGEPRRHDPRSAHSIERRKEEHHRVHRACASATTSQMDARRSYNIRTVSSLERESEALLCQRRLIRLQFLDDILLNEGVSNIRDDLL